MFVCAHCRKLGRWLGLSLQLCVCALPQLEAARAYYLQDSRHSGSWGRGSTGEGQDEEHHWLRTPGPSGPSSNSHSKLADARCQPASAPPAAAQWLGAGAGDAAGQQGQQGRRLRGGDRVGRERGGRAAKHSLLSRLEASSTSLSTLGGANGSSGSLAGSGSGSGGGLPNAGSAASASAGSLDVLPLSDGGASGREGDGGLQFRGSFDTDSSCSGRDGVAGGPLGGASVPATVALRATAGAPAMPAASARRPPPLSLSALGALDCSGLEEQNGGVLAEDGGPSLPAGLGGYGSELEQGSPSHACLASPCWEPPLLVGSAPNLTGGWL